MVTDNGELMPFQSGDEVVWTLMAFELVRTIADALEPHMSQRDPDASITDRLLAGDREDRRLKATMLRGLANFIEGKAIHAGG